MKFVCSLKEIVSVPSLHFGGKAESLSRLIRAGLPVPGGFAVASEAFRDRGILPESEAELKERIGSLSGSCTYAVRSSAVGEDGKSSSFAGMYDTVLDVRKEDILTAVMTVLASAGNGRVSVYRENAKGTAGDRGVIIQRFIKSDFAGVLFTADIITGIRRHARKLCAGLRRSTRFGNVRCRSFSFDALRYRYTGDMDFLPNARKLYRHSVRIRKLFSSPQDIEWAVCGRRVYILQSRPITTLDSHDEDRYDINDSRSGEYLLSKTNVGEIFMRPVSPRHTVCCARCLI
jgi:pyruvate,water dikinase